MTQTYRWQLPFQTRFAHRAIYCSDSDFTAAYPSSEPRPFTNMNLNIMECWIGSGTTNILTRMNLIASPHMGWSSMGNFTPSTGGGTFAISDANITTIVNGIKNHARNSHIYYIGDEPNITHLSGTSPFQPTYTTGQQNANRDSLRARRNLIKSLDPLAIVVIADFRIYQISSTAPNLSNGYLGGSGRTYGMWGGTDVVGATTYTDRVVDEVWLSGYSSPDVDTDPNTIPDQASWCEDAGVPYSGVFSVHRNPVGGSNPAYPTDAQVSTQIAKIKATHSERIVLYTWDQDGVDPRLATDSGKQARVASEMALVM